MILKYNYLKLSYSLLSVEYILLFLLILNPIVSAQTIDEIYKQNLTKNNTSFNFSDFPIDDSTIWGPSLGSKWFSCDVTKNNSCFFVVWLDDRKNDYYSIYGARINKDGSVIDKEGILISNLTSVPLNQIPKVASDGSNFLVVWSMSTNTSDWMDIVGKRVSSDGIVMDDSVLIINKSPYHQFTPDIAFDGTNYCVVWEDERTDGNSGDIYGTRISTAGKVFNIDGIPICKNVYEQYGPKISFNGSKYCVVWSDGRSFGENYDIYGKLISPKNLSDQSAEFPVCTAGNYQTVEDITYGDSVFLVVWSDRRVKDWDIYGTRIDTSGKTLDGSGFLICNALGTQQRPHVAFDGTEFLVVWQDARNDEYWHFYGNYVSVNGTVLNTSGFPLITNYQCEMASLIDNEQECFLSWVGYFDPVNEPSQVFGSLVTSQGGLISSDRNILSTSKNVQRRPDVIYGGNQFLVAWEDNKYGANRICGKILPVDNNNKNSCLTIANIQGTNINSSLSFNNKNYIISWERKVDDSSSIFYTELDRSGQLLFNNPILVTEPENEGITHSNHCSGSSGFLVVWEDYWYEVDFYYQKYRAGIYAKYIPFDDISGEFPLIKLASDSSNHTYPRVASNGSSFLVVWKSTILTKTPNEQLISGIVINSNGTGTDSQEIKISSQGIMPAYPSVASDGNSFLVVWQDYRNNSYNIYGAIVDKTGNVTNPKDILISAETDQQTRPKVCFDGLNYIVSWEDNKVGTSKSIINICRVDFSGNVLDKDGIPVSSDNYNHYLPQLASDLNGNSLLVFENKVGNDNNTSRIYASKFNLESTNIAENAGKNISFILYQNYPNPFNPVTEIKFEIPFSANIQITIYNCLGEKVIELLNTEKKAGVYTVKWDGKNDCKNDVPSGIYFINLTANNYVKTIKSVLLR